MSEPRLNSVHLDAQRREEFRRAREFILQARGQQTLNLESREAFERSSGSGTYIEPQHNAVPLDLKYFIQDTDFVYPLKVGLNTIGRLPDNDIVIQDGHVSRRHCAIVVHSRDVCEVHDVASKNGTFLNGSKISGPTRLTSGDEIRMCDHSITFKTQPNGEGPQFSPTSLPATQH